MEQSVAVHDTSKVMESVILKGDISALTPTERVQYYKAVCESVGLNPLTQPLAYIVLSGKATLYAKRDATDQLRKIHGVSVTSSTNQRVEDVYIVTVGVMDKTGRTDMGTGAVTVKGLSGDALANAIMKAETKAKRRATLSICGLGLLDETELETIPDKTKSVPLIQRVSALLADIPCVVPEPAMPSAEPLATQPVEAGIDGHLTRACESLVKTIRDHGTDPIETGIDGIITDSSADHDDMTFHADLPSDDEPTFTRGKHRGMKPSEVDSGYLRWYEETVKDGDPLVLEAVKSERARRHFAQQREDNER